MAQLSGCLQLAGAGLTLLGAIITAAGIASGLKRTDDRFQRFLQGVRELPQALLARIQQVVDRMADAYDISPQEPHKASFTVGVGVDVTMDARAGMHTPRIRGGTAEKQLETIWNDITQLYDNLRQTQQAIAAIRVDTGPIYATIGAVKEEIAEAQNLVAARDFCVAIIGAALVVAGTGLSFAGILLGL